MIHAIKLLRDTMVESREESFDLSADGDTIGSLRAGYIADDCRKALEILESHQTTETNATPNIVNQG